MTNALHLRSYYPSLDGLRGLAILAILLCHNFDFIPFAQYGRIGVDIFFVLSGFLITEILLQTKEDKYRLRNFFIRRVLRIFPLYYVAVILFFLFVKYLPAFSIQYHYYTQHRGMVWLHLHNWLYFLYEKPVYPAPLLNHFWSLSLEEQFYLVWPFLIFFCKRSSSIIQILLVILFACIAIRFVGWWHWGNNYRYFYFQSIARLDGFCIGGLIATWRFYRLPFLKNLIKLASILIALQIILWLLSRTLYPTMPHTAIGGYAVLAAIVGITLTVSFDKKFIPVQQFLSNSFLRSTGKISYGLYVYHWPVLILCRIYLPGYITNNSSNMSTILISLIALIITVLLSVLSYHFIERKFLSLKYKWAP